MFRHVKSYNKWALFSSSRAHAYIIRTESPVMHKGVDAHKPRNGLTESTRSRLYPILQTVSGIASCHISRTAVEFRHTMVLLSFAFLV
jgi:hypothetical protein